MFTFLDIDSMKGSPDSDPPLWIIGVVMGTIILLIAAGVIIGIFIWRYKNQGQGEDSCD